MLGAPHTVVVVGAGRDQVEEHLAGELADLAPGARAVVQEEQLGSGHAAAVALAALPDLDGAVLLVNGDAPLLRARTVTDLVEAHRASGAALTVLTAELADPTGLGRIVRTADGVGPGHRRGARRDARSERRSARSTPGSTSATPRRCAGRWSGWAGPTTRGSSTSPTSSACSSPTAGRSAAPRPPTRPTCWAATTSASSPTGGAPSTTGSSTG